MKYFKSLWRNDNIHKHMTEQHELKFAEYKQLIPEARNVFASNDTTFQPMNASNVSLNMLVDKYLVLCTSNGCGCPKGNDFCM